MRINQLLEAKFRKPITMFHGTSTKFLRSILKTGMVPNPRDKKWDVDPGASLTTQSRVSLTGSYWSGRLMTATSSALNTTGKFGGNSLLIIAQIQTQDAKADEDQISFDIPREYDYAFGGVYSNNPDLVARVYYDSRDYYNEKKEIFIKNIHNSFTENPNKPVPTKLLSNLFDTFTLRIISYGVKEAGTDSYYNPLNRIKNKPNEVPETDEIEKQLLNIKDKLTKYYRETTEDSGKFSHTLRITEPVTFSGANRITHILEIPKHYFDENKKFVQPPLILHYGNSKTLPKKFMDEYTSRIGDFTGLVDKNGNLLDVPNYNGEKQ
jgi:hypothetical protein